MEIYLQNNNKLSTNIGHFKDIWLKIVRNINDSMQIIDVIVHMYFANLRNVNRDVDTKVYVVNSLNPNVDIKVDVDIWADRSFFDGLDRWSAVRYFLTVPSCIITMRWTGLSTCRTMNSEQTSHLVFPFFWIFPAKLPNPIPNPNTKPEWNKKDFFLCHKDISDFSWFFWSVAAFQTGHKFCL
jgi:hypothetical protein